MLDSSKLLLAEHTASVRWALASLSLTMLMPSLDTSITNAGLPTLAQAFSACFQSVQWITSRIGSAMGLLGTMSAIGTTLGPVNVVLAIRHIPLDLRVLTGNRAGFDHVGTLLLALSLGAYALSMTIARGHFGSLNIGLLMTAAFGVVLFVQVEAKAASPLIRLALFRDPGLSPGFAMSTLVSTVMMATVVVGPLYLAKALGLDIALVGLILSIGPLVAALTGVQTGRLVDRLEARAMTNVGLIGIATGFF